MGFGVTVRAVVHAGLLTGFLIGLLDAVTIATDPSVRLSAGELVFAGLQGIALYVGFFVVVGLLVSPIVHKGFYHTPLGVRARHAFAMVLGVGIFMELYWWTRPYVFYGRPSTSPERLFSAFVMIVASWALGALCARALAKQNKRVRGTLEGCAWVALIVGVGGLLFGNAAPAERGKINERTQDLPNVLLVVVDALRADVIGAYGNQRVQTPVMDRLAENGVVFENAFAQAPYTWTSFGSILTGKYPRRHGLMKMKPGVRMSPNATLAWHLKEAASKTGQAQLQPADIASGTFMTGTLSQGSGLMRGFDVYFEALVGHELVDSEIPWSVYRSDLVLLKFKNKITQRFDSTLVVNTAADWLRENRGRRFAAMVHLYSTHTPYDPEPEFRDLYVDPAYDGPIQAFYAEHRYAIENGEYKPTPADVEQIRNLYYGGVTQADAAIGQVLDELKKAGDLENTLVVITADHGESLGDDILYGNPLWEHNWMFETNLRVPLIMSWPKGLAQNVVVPDIVETVDIVPTICDLMGLVDPGPAADAEQAGIAGGGALSEVERNALDEQRRQLIDGHSLVPLVRKTLKLEGDLPPRSEWDGFAFAENGPYLSIRDSRWKLVAPRDALGEAEWLKALKIPSAKGPRPTSEEIRELEKRPRLFDLQNDPAETRDLIQSEDPFVAAERRRMYVLLKAWSDSMPVPAMEIAQSHRDLEHSENLSGLGYTGEEADESPSDRLKGAASDPEATEPAPKVPTGPEPATTEPQPE
jgi:arylsulfatase